MIVGATEDGEVEDERGDLFAWCTRLHDVRARGRHSGSLAALAEDAARIDARVALSSNDDDPSLEPRSTDPRARRAATIDGVWSGARPRGRAGATARGRGDPRSVSERRDRCRRRPEAIASAPTMPWDLETIGGALTAWAAARDDVDVVVGRRTYEFDEDTAGFADVVVFAPDPVLVVVVHGFSEHARRLVVSVWCSRGAALWIVDDDGVLCFPAGGSVADGRRLAAGEPLTCSALPGLVIDG